ncbi:MAG: ligase-associated DNA damage response endonuclease PdeM [Chloroherpetonaceae bacterium]|nr:ligase-associated DNA damage response endonuclease PdeM [Chloroherpetonaceae bacterium]
MTSVLTQFGSLLLLPSKTLFLPDKQILLAADVHLGKAETFQAYGVPVPSGHSARDLSRLREAAIGCNAKTIFLLGDFFHAPEGLTPSLVSEVNEWIESLLHEGISVTLIVGNHEKRVSFSSLSLTIHRGPMAAGDFIFDHHPSETAGRLTFAGHLHPRVSIGGKQSRLRLPCFLVSERQVILPAFGDFTGGAATDTRGFDVYVVTENSVEKWEEPVMKKRRGRYF